MIDSYIGSMASSRVCILSYSCRHSNSSHCIGHNFIIVLYMYRERSKRYKYTDSLHNYYIKVFVFVTTIMTEKLLIMAMVW